MRRRGRCCGLSPQRGRGGALPPGDNVRPRQVSGPFVVGTGAGAGAGTRTWCPLHIPGPLPNITGIVVADRDESLSPPRLPPPCGPKSVADPSGTAQGLGGAGACRAVAGTATKSLRCERTRNCEDEQENRPSQPNSKACTGLNADVESHQDTTWLVLDNLATFTNAAHRFPVPNGVARRGLLVAPAG